MKQFFKFMFASMLGFLVMFVLFLFLIIGMFASLASFGSKEPKAVASKSVFHLELTNEIVDRGMDNPFGDFNFMALGTPGPIGLNELLLNIKKAREDENIEGIFLDMSYIQAGWASAHEIRNQLIDFKESGKFLIAYGNYMTQGAYYLASVADSIYLNPEGSIDFRGMNAEVMFLKNMLEKIGVEMQVIRHGKYKGAGEMFLLDRLSPENREQIQSYVSSIWNTTTKEIAEQRGLTINQLNDIANSFATRTAEGALENKMIDGIAHRDEIMDMLKEKLDLSETKKVNLVDYSTFNRSPLPDNMIPVGRRDKIAVIYASGNVVMGQGSETNMGADRIAEALRTARQDSTIKAIVFRINSPGGVVLAGDIILREAMLAGETKPLVVSMGNVAASAGYYVGAYADKIIANPNTITGSIGVFGIIPNLKEMFNDKLGITFDNVKTNDLANLGSLNRAMTRTEREIIQQIIERAYENFINHVAEGRGMTVASVDSIAQGRIWSGVDAKRIGLVDDFGGLYFSIEEAARLADVEKYRVVEYPVAKDFFERLREGLGSAEARILKSRLGDSYSVMQNIQNVKENSGVLMRMPYDVKIE
jgi:protease IV